MPTEAPSLNTFTGFLGELYADVPPHDWSVNRLSGLSESLTENRLENAYRILLDNTQWTGSGYYMKIPGLKTDDRYAKDVALGRLGMVNSPMTKMEQELLDLSTMGYRE